MRILMLGSKRSWMGLHLSHMEGAFRRRGHEIFVFDYHDLSAFCGVIPLPSAWADEQRQRSLEKLVKRFRPDLVYCVGSWKYDFPRLKSYFRGVSALHDLDGPRRLTPHWTEPFGQVDLPLTASRYLMRALSERGIPSFYLPSAADPDYYAPVDLTESDRLRFGAPVSYIGRATKRRVRFCAPLADHGLALYGDRWASNRESVESGLPRCMRLRRNVEGRELVKIYQASTAVVNILQEPLDEYRTILSLQCFAVPSTGRCLLAEYVEEAAEAFEDGTEILLFRTPEELFSQTERVLSDPSFAEKIGAAGRKRCLACHTHEHRVAALEKLL